jgi:hypothetical protein
MQPTLFPPQDLEVAVHHAIGRLGRVEKVSYPTHMQYYYVCQMDWIIFNIRMAIYRATNGIALSNISAN